jgi:plastocyanin
MLEQIWNSFLELTTQFVTPDWGRLIFLMPVGLVILVLAILLRTVMGLARAPKARRGKQRIAPRTPAGIHMPGPSFAPAFAAVGMFLLFLGLVFGGPILILGAIALVLTLVYWLVEGVRLYDRDIGPTIPEVPAVIHDGPPPGVHMPGPSWRPFLGAFGMFTLFLGLVFGGLLLAVGVIALVSTLIGWLSDAVKEFRKTVEADTTGHLENPPTSGTPSRLFGTLIVLIVGAALLQSGVLGTGAANGGVGGSPAPSGAPAGGPVAGSPGAPASGGPAPSGPTADVHIEAKNVAFVEGSFTAPAAKPFTIAFANEDPGTPHNIELKDASGGVAFKGAVFNGVDTKIYDVPALPAGAYTYLCIVHPTMTGTATLQ